MRDNTNSISVTHERTLTVRRPEFKFSDHVRYLDPRRLSGGSHSIEIGRLEGHGCDLTVTAHISDGIITALEHGSCDNARPVSPALDDKLVGALRKLTKDAARIRSDVPVEDIIADAAVGRMTDIDVWDDCFQVCWDEGIGEECVICCFEPTRHWCIGPSEPTRQL